MAEINQNDVFSQFKITEPTVIEPKIITPEKKEDDVFSQFQVTETTPPLKIETKPVVLSTPVDEPTFLEKLAYGIDKQNQFFGNLFRVGKAGIEAAFDPDKDFKDVALENAEEEKIRLYERHAKFSGGAFDDDFVVKAAEMATFLLDPYYILAYMTPWGRAATAGTTGLKATAKLAGLSGGTIGLDTLFNNLATYGEARPAEVGLTTASGAVLGPLSVKAFRTISKLLPGADKKQVANVIEVMEGATAKKLGISNQQYKVLQKIASDKSFLELNRQIKIAGDNWVKPIAREQDIFYKEIQRLDKKIKKLSDKKKATKGKGSKKAKETISEKILQIRKDQKLKQKVFDDAQKKLWEKQSAASKKAIDLAAKRDVMFLEKLWNEKSLTEKTAQIVLATSVRPLFGGGVGYAFGKLWGGDDANLSNWFLTGATLGAIQKGIQASKILPGQSKNMLQRLLYTDARQVAFQKVRELTSTTTSSKLAAIGGETEKIGLQLLENIDSSISKFSVARRAEDLFQTWKLRAFNVAQGYSEAEQAAALSIVRGSKAKVFPGLNTTRVNALANKIRKELSDFTNLRQNAGLFSLDEKAKKRTGIDKIMEIKNYFPRVYNFDVIRKDPDKFEKVIFDIYKSLGKTDKSAKELTSGFVQSLRNVDDSIQNKDVIKELVLGTTKKETKAGAVIKNLPLSEHITKKRILDGPYAKVEKILEQNGYLVNNVNDVLQNLYNRSMKSIAFAERFGNKGQFLEKYIIGIRDKYLKLAERLPEQYTKEKARQLAQNEINLVMNTIDGFFERYGQAQKGYSKGVAGVLATISNLNMLDRVTIASLGDLAQPFTNSNNYLSWFKGAVRTGFTNKRETGIAKDLLLDLDKKLNNEISNSLLKSSGVAQGAMDDATKAVNVMGKMGANRKLNELAFKGLGLTWLTGLARRYAFNTGAIDAYGSARKLYKFVGNKNSLNSSKGLRLTRDVNRYNIDVQDALKLGKFNTFDEAVADKASRKLLSTAGILAANRDALIPQVSNRLLFTQSRNPWVRLMGQFTSWAMAKSTQTNKLLQRIENGDVRQLVKLVAALPVFGGIQMLREIAKHGEIKTDPSNEEGKWWAEAVRLSGMGGILPELFIGRLTGPGSYRPWFLPFPAASIAIDAGDIGKDVFAGKTDKATQKFMDRIFPLPTWRNWIGKLFDNVNISRPLEGTAIDAQTFKPQEFNLGGVVSKALLKAVSKSGVNRAKTAISTTEGTYTKANKILTDLNKNNVHDFGSGLGVGTKQFKNKNVTSHEPFVPIERIVKFDGIIPKYRSASETIKKEGIKSKDGVVNLNVLNVIEDKAERSAVIKDIGKLLSDDGVAIITTRGADVNTQAKTSKNAVKYLDGWLFGDKEKTFQKGFSQSELEKLVKLVLGKEFKVEKIPSKYKIGTSGVLISRIKQLSTGGRVGFSEGDEVDVFSQFKVTEPTVDDQVSTMMEKEKVIVPKKKPNLTVDLETQERIKEGEGKENMPYKLEYKTSDGKTVKENFYTVGHGHRIYGIENNPNEINRVYSDEEIEELFQKDLKDAVDNVNKYVDRNKVDPKAYGILVEMAYQMGGKGLGGFTKTLEAIKKGNYQEASKQMLFNYDDDGQLIGKTNWHNQTGKRAKKLAKLMANIFVDKD